MICVTTSRKLVISIAAVTVVLASLLVVTMTVTAEPTAGISVNRWDPDAQIPASVKTVSLNAQAVAGNPLLEKAIAEVEKIYQSGTPHPGPYQEQVPLSQGNALLSALPFSEITRPAAASSEIDDDLGGTTTAPESPTNTVPVSERAVIVSFGGNMYIIEIFS